MTNFLLGMLTMYLTMGIIILIINSLDLLEEDGKDIIFGWWLIPLVLLTKTIKRSNFNRRKKREKRGK